MIPQQSPISPENGRWDTVSIRPVKWGSLDIVVAITVTVLVVVAILTLSGSFGTDAGYDTTIASPNGYYIGLLAVGIALVVLRLFHYPSWPILAALGAGGGVLVISYQFGNDAGDGTAQFVGVPVGIIAATAMSGVFAATGFAFSIVRYREPLSSLGFVKTNGIRPYLFAVAMWLIGLSVLIFWLQALVWLGFDSLVPPDTAREILDEAGGSIVITIILVGILGPIAEEIFFRGYILPGFVRRFGVGRALLFSSLIFGSFHIDPGAIVPTFALGMVLGWVYLKTGSIWPAMFAHGLHNTVAVLVAKYATVN